MEFQDVIYEVDGPVAIVRLNRPRYRNAQSWRLLDEMDAAFDQAVADQSVRVIVLMGLGEHFSSGHDIGTPEQLADRERRGIAPDTLGFYDNFRLYNLDLNLKWRNLPKPTIAMVHGFCIYGGWMIAASMDLVFAAEDALFLAGLVEYFSIPWDLGPRKAKEIVFESRFITAEEAREQHFVNRVIPRDELERETIAYAKRVAENSPAVLRLAKDSINKMLDAQGFSQNMETAFHDYLVQTQARRGEQTRRTDIRRLAGVDLAMRRLRPEPEATDAAPAAGGGE